MNGIRSRVYFVTLLSSTLAFCSDLAQANVFNMGPGLASLEFVPVGNPGNPPEPQEEYGEVEQLGSVSRAFRMGKYEVTSAQYVEFLNAVARTDLYGLYNPDMW